MSDPLRSELTSPAQADHDAAERDAKIESLLLAGLDYYFASDYAQAIDVWTRALFLDRNHTRARAYIERARSALGEQQRESDELIHNGVAAFERGELEAARQLLNAAVQRGGAHEVALAFLTRIDRVSAGPAPVAPVAPLAEIRSTSHPPSVQGIHRRRVMMPLAFALAIVVAAACVALSWDQLRALVIDLPVGRGAATDLAPARVSQEPLVVPTSSETALDRARALFASGRLYDAIRAADLVRPTDPLRSDADRLKATIQRELLAHADVPSPAVSSTP
jgi:tetratricopeptide (TPR) repeat protein